MQVDAGKESAPCYLNRRDFGVPGDGADDFYGDISRAVASLLVDEANADVSWLGEGEADGSSLSLGGVKSEGGDGLGVGKVPPWSLYRLKTGPNTGGAETNSNNEDSDEDRCKRVSA